jgi:hypothetical protein
MSFALIEVEALAKKAVRGTGYSWGIAEDAAKATRWLCAAGLDGVGALANLLAHVDGSDLSQMRPGQLRGDWQAEAGEICPLLGGTALADSANLWAEGGKRLNNVSVPVLLLSFAALAARQLDSQISVEWPGVRAVTDGSRIDLTCEEQGKLLATADLVTVQVGGQIADPLPAQTRARPDTQAWAAVAEMAQRTHAPDTEESRILGAGAGLSDND